MNTAAVLAIITPLLILALAARGTLFSRHRPRRMYWRIRCRLRPGPGFASLGEVIWHWSRLAAVRHGHRARPSLGLRGRLTTSPDEYAVYQGRAQYGRKTWTPMEYQVLSIGPPRTLKSGVLTDRIASHPGPVLCTSTRADLYHHTAAYRARLGPAYVFNPERVGGLRSTVSFDILAGCEDPATVIRRADALVGARSSDGDLRQWQDLAAQALAMLMHLAALRQETMLQVWQWAHDYGAGTTAIREAITMSGASHEVLAPYHRISRDSRTADSIKTIMSGALGSWITIPAITALVSGAGPQPLNPARFATGGGTLYLITATADSACAPIFRVIASEVHYHAGLAGSRSPHGRLDPPLLMALDEVCQICAVPLPEWLSDSAGKGILIEAVCHGTGQLRHRYGDYGAQTILETCGTWRVYPGIKNEATLREISGLLGRHHSGEGKDEPAVPPEVIRMLPDHHILVVSQNRSPVVVRGRPVWRRRGHRPAPAPAWQPQAPAIEDITAEIEAPDDIPA